MKKKPHNNLNNKKFKKKITIDKKITKEKIDMVENKVDITEIKVAIIKVTIKVVTTKVAITKAAITKVVITKVALTKEVTIKAIKVVIIKVDIKEKDNMRIEMKTSSMMTKNKEGIQSKVLKSKPQATKLK